MIKKNVFWQILTVVSILFLILLINVFVNVKVYFTIKNAKESIIQNIENLTDFKITYQKISPYILGKIKIFEVVLSNSRGTRLELGNIEVSYSPYHYLQYYKESPISIISKIKLKSFQISVYNKKEFQELKDLFERIKKRKKKNIVIKNLTIEIPQGKFILYNKNKELVLEINNMKAKINEKVNFYSIFSFSMNKNQEVIFQSKIKARGLIENLNSHFTSNMNFQIIETFINDLKMKDQSFKLISTGSDFSINRIKDNVPLTFQIKKEKNLISSQILFDKINFNDLFTWQNKNKEYPILFDIKSHMTFNINTKQSNGIIDLYINNKKYLFLENSEIILKADITDNLINLNDFTINNISKNNYIKISGQVPFDNRDFELNLLAKNFRLPMTTINTDIIFLRSDKTFSLQGKSFWLNKEYLGPFHYKMIYQKNHSKFLTIKSFNGYTFNGDIYKRENEKEYNFIHNFNSFSLDKIMKAYSPKYQNKLSIRGFLNHNLSQGIKNITDSSFQIIQNSQVISSFVIKLENQLLEVTNQLKSNSDNALYLHSWANFRRSPLTFFLKIYNNNFKVNILSRINKGNFDLTINENLNLRIDLKEKRLYASADNFLIPSRSNKAKLNFDLYYDIHKRTIPKTIVYINNLTLFNHEKGNFKARISMINHLLKIDNIEYRDNSNLIEGDSEFYYNHKTGTISGNGFLSDKKKDESYSLDLNYKNGNINSKFYITHFDINKIISGQITGHANMRLNIYGKIKDPKIDCQFNLLKGQLRGNKLEAAFLVKKDIEGIKIKNGFFKISDNFMSLKDSIIRINENKYKDIFVSGRLNLDGMGKHLITSFKLTGGFKNFNDPLMPVKLRLTFDRTVLYFPQKRFFFDKQDIKYPSFTILFEKKGNQITINDLERKYFVIKKTRRDLSADFFQNDKNIFQSRINYANQTIDGYLTFNEFPINIIENVLRPFIGIEEGLVDGRINLKGPVKKPEFNGELNLYYGVVDLSQYLQEKITNISGFIIADKNKFLVRNVNAEVRKGLAHGYGEIIFNGFKFERFLFHLNSNNIPGQINQGPVNAKGTGYIEDLIIEGKPQNFNFIGNLVLETADINLASLMGTNKKKVLPKTPINVLMNFRSGKRVKVNYPIYNGIVKEGQEFSLKYIGEIPRVYLDGTVEFAKGEVNYLNKKFKIENAVFQFFEDEESINPNVNLRAVYKTKDSKRDPVKIYLTLNDRLISFETKNINTQFSSYPVKSQEEIYSLLGLNYALLNQNEKSNNKNDLWNDNNQSNSIDTIVDTTNYISNSFIFSPFENKVRQMTGLDTFSLDTKLLGNIIKYNMNNDINTLDLLDESSITLGKYIFNELYFESMMSFNKKKEGNEEFFLPFNNENYGLNLQLMLQLELQNLSIGYSFAPKNYLDILDADHKISLEANFRL